jgi:hypothetical protein
MVRSSIVIKKLEEKDRDTAAEFVSRMMKWTVKTYSKRRYPKSALDHQILVATGTLDKSIEDPDHYCMLAIKDGETIGIALGQVLGSDPEGASLGRRLRRHEQVARYEEARGLTRPR